MNMNISNSISTSYNYQKYTQSQNSTALSLPQLKQDTVSFKGHLSSEKYAKDGIKFLRHETGLFRDIQTKEFVRDYVMKKFADNEVVRFIIGGCSTGEEAFTYRMLLDPFNDKLKITGFDLSKDSVKTAKSGKVLMQRLKDAPEGFVAMMPGVDTSLADAYLCFDGVLPKTAKEVEYKKMFDRFFDITSEAPPEQRYSLLQRFRLHLLKKYLRLVPPSFEGKYVQLKPEISKDLEFVEGDIMKLGDVAKGEKADVITFSNAMYHLTCNDFGVSGLRFPKENSEEIVTSIAEQVRLKLNNDGLFVLGENEAMQTLDVETVPKVFKKMGFKPHNATEEHFANVWQLVK